MRLNIDIKIHADEKKLLECFLALWTLPFLGIFQVNDFR